MGKWGDTAGGAASGASAGAVLGPWGAAAGGLIGGAMGYFGSGGDDENRKRLLAEAQAAKALADQAQRNFLGVESQAARKHLYDQMMGKHSVAAEQLRQGVQQQVAAQRAMAASASPRNLAMAQRNAAMNAGRATHGMAGQAALAGVQERNAAADAFAALRGQDMQAALQSRQAAMTGYGGPGEKSWIEQYGPAVVAGLDAYGRKKTADADRAERAAARKASAPTTGPKRNYLGTPVWGKA